MGACSTTTEAMRKMGCKTSGGRLFCNDRSGAETVKHPGVSALRRPKQSGDLGPMGACHATTEAMRKMGRKTSGGRLLCNDRAGGESCHEHLLQPGHAGLQGIRDASALLKQIGTDQGPRPLRFKGSLSSFLIL